MNSHSAENSSHFPSLITAVVCVAALYFGRDVLIPIALAMLLTFFLAPVVSRLERFLGNTIPTLAMLFVALVLIVLLGWVVFQQAIHLATELPSYSDTISDKLESLRGVRNSKWGAAAASIRQLGDQLSVVLQPSAQSSGNNQAVQKPPRISNNKTAKPVPVQVVQGPANFGSIRATFGPVFIPIAKIVVIFVVAAFMLLRRKNLQERLFTLAGLHRINITKRVFTEATNRVVHYLWLLSCVNAAYGLVFGTALYFLGLPNAFLWGVLAGVLRFIPYVGSAVGAAMPLLFSLAVFAGWMKPLIALAIYLLLELGTAYVVEPMLYGSRTGISSLAILVSAIFWAVLWGPIGLLLSTPLTVCIVVMGRYIPQLEFLNILFGDNNGGSDVQLYLALTSSNVEESRLAIDEYLQEKPIGDLYDSVFVPILVLAERDQPADSYRGHGRRQLFRRLRATVEDLSVRYPKPTHGTQDSAEIGHHEQILPYRHPDATPITVSCLPIRDEGDEIASLMLTHLLNRAGCDAREIELASTREMLDEVAEHDGHIICTSGLPPFAVSSLCRLYKRIQSRFPKDRVVLGLWTYSGDVESMKSLLKLDESDLVCTTLGEAVLQIQQFVEAPEGQPARRSLKR
jgi:predicted PurR-regulated permease PerM